MINIEGKEVTVIESLTPPAFMAINDDVKEFHYTYVLADRGENKGQNIFLYLLTLLTKQKWNAMCSI